MNRSIFALLAISIFSSKSFSQIDYDKINHKRLYPITIDTLNQPVIVIQKQFATLYFKQSDILKYIKPYNKFGVRIDQNHDNIKELLLQNSQYVRIIDWWSDYTESERNINARKTEYSSQYEQFVTEFHYIGADLIHDGKFMLVDNQSGEIRTKGLVIKKQKGLYGTEYVLFMLSPERSFWNVLTRIGE